MAGPAAEAYIIMRADGTLLPRDVKKFAGEAGEEFGEEFSDAVDKEIGAAGQRGIKRLHSRLGTAINDIDFSPLMKKGEKVETFVNRLNEAAKELYESNQMSIDAYGEYADSLSEWAQQAHSAEEAAERAKRENEDWTKAKRADVRVTREQNAEQRESNDLSKSTERLLDSVTRKYEKRERTVNSLGIAMRDLNEKQRQWIVSAAQTAQMTDNWGPFIKKVGGADRALQKLLSATSEVRDSTSEYDEELNNLERSLVTYIEEAEEAARAEALRAEALQEEKDLLRDVSREEKEHSRWLERKSRLYADVTDASGDMLDKMIASLANAKDQGKAWDDLNAHLRRTGRITGKVKYGMEETDKTIVAVTDHLEEMRREGVLTDDAFESLNREVRDFSESVRQSHFEIGAGSKRRDRFIGDLTRMSDAAARFSGRGARNDFINLFGAMIGGITRLTLVRPAQIFGVAADAVGVFRGSMEKMTKAVSEGGRGMSTFASIGPSLVRSLGSVGKAAGGALAGFVVLSQALGALASFLSLFAGMLVIAGRAVYLSFAAPIVAAIPAIAAFGAGAVIAGTAISRWAENSKAFEQAMKPVSAELDTLAKRITPAMDGLSRLFGKASLRMVQEFGGSVERVLNNLYENLSDPAMDQFYDQWAVSMPKTFESLGNAISDFTTGLVAFFTPILPYAERLAGAIERAAARFDEWARSTEGQNSIADWMENAWDTAVKLWSGLQDIWSGLGNIFSLADKEGRGFAGWIQKIGEDFREWTESEEGREAIKEWLSDAADLAGDLGGIISNLAGAFDELDSESGREALDNFITLFEAVAAAAEVAADVINGINWVIDTSGVGNGLQLLMDNMSSIIDGDMPGLVQNYKDHMLEVYNFGADLFGAEREDSFGAAFDASLERVKSSFSTFGSWISDTVGGWWGATQTGFSQWWASVSAWFTEKKTEVGTKVKDWMTVDWAGIWSDFTASMSSGWETVSGWFTQKGEETKQKITDFFTVDWAAVWANVQEGMNQFVFMVGLSVGKVIGFFLDLPMNIWNGLTATWDSLTQWGEGMKLRIITALTNAGLSITNWASSTWESFNTWRENTWNAFTTWATALPGKIWGGLQAAANAIIEWGASTWESFNTWRTNTWLAITLWATELPGKILVGLTNAGVAILEWTTQAKDDFTKWWSEIDWTQIFEDVKQGILTGLTTVGTWLLDQGKTLFDSFIDGVKEGLGIASPSQVMIDLMGDVGEGIKQGLLAIPKKIAQSALAIGKKIVAKVKEGLNPLDGNVGKKFQSAKDRAEEKLTSLGKSVNSKFGGMPGKAFNALKGLPGQVLSRFQSTGKDANRETESLVSKARGTLSGMAGKAGSALSNLPGRVQSPFNLSQSRAQVLSRKLVDRSKNTLSQMAGAASRALSGLAGRVASPYQSANSRARSLVNSIKNTTQSVLGGIPWAIRWALGGVTGAITGPFQSALGIVRNIVNSIASLASRAMSLGNSVSGGGWSLPWTASGGTFVGAQARIIGEAGPEAVVPLNRPLHQVDPSVRALSAIAQGKAGVGGGTTIESGAIQVVTPYSDPELVAHRVLDDLVANF